MLYIYIYIYACVNRWCFEIVTTNGYCNNTPNSSDDTMTGFQKTL